MKPISGEIRAAPTLVNIINDSIRTLAIDALLNKDAIFAKTDDFFSFMKTTNLECRLECRLS